MKQLVKLLLLSVLFCFLASTSTGQKSGRRARRPSPPSIICKIESVPNGLVVIGYKRNSACRGGSQLLVKRPEKGDIIGAESPMPPQFSIVTKVQGHLLGTCPTKALLIQATSVITAPVVDDSAISSAFASGASDIPVEGEGTVIRVLPDDLNEPRHQRFIVQLASGQTLLMTHNIDIAPRIEGLKVGDTVRFNGEYAWNEKGGVIHWTHHDPQGRHVAGWIKHNGKTFK